MSDNQALIESNEALTAAILGLTAEVAAGNAGRAAVLEAAKGATAKPAAGAKAAKAAEPKAEAAEKPAAKAEPATDEPVADVIGDLVVEYVSAAPKDSEERAARKAKVKKLFGKVGAEKHTDIAAENIDAVADALRTLISKGNVIVEEVKPAASAASLLDDDE